MPLTEEDCEAILSATQAEAAEVRDDVLWESLTEILRNSEMSNREKLASFLEVFEAHVLLGSDALLTQTNSHLDELLDQELDDPIIIAAPSHANVLGIEEKTALIDLLPHTAASLQEVLRPLQDIRENISIDINDMNRGFSIGREMPRDDFEGPRL